MHTTATKPLLILLSLLLLTACGSRKGVGRQATAPLERSTTTAQAGTIQSYGPNKLFNQYIEQYATAALDNQHAYGIPASITLAQGLLESGAGRSTLARSANNHFGIKCHRSWRGSRTYHTDDRPNECFRAYDHPSDSYADHAQFLQQPRYRSLYQLAPTDYKGWARGLQQAGYATDKGYANKLIKIIEDYQLYLIDRGSTDRHYSYNKPSSPKRSIAQQVTPKVAPTEEPTFEKPTQNPRTRQLYQSYGLKYILADKGDTLSDIARDLGIKEKRLTRYNELPVGYPLEEGDVIYLEPKLKRAMPPYYEHKVSVGESIHTISQRYGIQLASLYQLNNLPPDYIPQEGDRLRLR